MLTQYFRIECWSLVFFERRKLHPPLAAAFSAAYVLVTSFAYPY